MYLFNFKTVGIIGEEIISMANAKWMGWNGKYKPYKWCHFYIESMKFFLYCKETYLKTWEKENDIAEFMFGKRQMEKKNPALVCNKFLNQELIIFLWVSKFSNIPFLISLPCSKQALLFHILWARAPFHTLFTVIGKSQGSIILKWTLRQFSLNLPFHKHFRYKHNGFGYIV